MLNPLKYISNRKVGLALGSGGAKGLAHIAVIEYLVSMGIPIDMIAGSSIGAVIGALYACGTLGKFREDMLKFSLRDLLAFMDPVVPRSGLIEGRGFMKFMGRYIPNIATIEDLEIPLAVLATDYISGMSVVLRSGNLLEALRASVSIPGVLVPVRHGESVLIDGGVANPLPINIVREMGAGITIAVNLHPRIKKRGLRHSADAHVTAAAVGGEAINAGHSGSAQKAEKRNILPGAGWVRAMEHWLRPGGRKRKKEMPNIFEVMAGSVDIMEYVNTALLLEYNTPTVLIEPDIIDVQTLDFADAKRIMEEGHRACVLARGTLVRKVAAWV
jgi:NTE family protein